MTNILLFLYLLSSLVTSFKPFFIQLDQFLYQFELFRYFGLAAGFGLIIPNWKKIIQPKTLIFIVITLYLTALVDYDKNDYLETLLNIGKVILMISVAIVLLHRPEWRERLTCLPILLLLATVVIGFAQVLVSELPVAIIILKIQQTIIPGQNYIASSIVGLGLLSLITRFQYSSSIILLCISLTFFLNSRTGMFALLMPLLYILYRKHPKILIAISPIIIFITNAIILSKWDSTNLSEATAGRLQPWLFYIDEATNSFSDLMPAIISNNNLLSFVGPDTGEYHSPHNLFISIILIFGWFAAFPIIGFILYSLSRTKDIFMRAAFLGLLVHASLEPVIWFSDNFLTFLFFLILLSSIFKQNRTLANRETPC